MVESGEKLGLTLPKRHPRASGRFPQSRQRPYAIPSRP
jgi:hypothetical protein